MVGTTLLLCLTVAATPTSQSPTIQPGSYALEITYGGGVIEGRLEIGFVRDSVTARLTVGDHGPVLTRIVRNGNRLTLAGGSAGSEVVYQLEFKGDTVNGTFTYNGAEGSLTGKRKPAGS